MGLNPQSNEVRTPLGMPESKSNTLQLTGISIDGMRAEHRFPLIRGKQVALEIDSDGEKLRIECEVARCSLVRTEAGVAYSSELRFFEDRAPTLFTIHQLVSGNDKREAVLMKVR